MKPFEASLSHLSAFQKDAFDEAVKFFGENAKTTPPSVFFPVFVRFVKAYRVSWFTSRVLLQTFLFAFFKSLSFAASSSR